MLRNGRSLRCYNDFAGRNGSGHCGDATMPRDSPWAHRDDERGREDSFLRRPNLHRIERPHALKIPARRAEYSLTENVASPFQAEPRHMRLLIVVDKLLTGFDAPTCTYLYVDKSMQDHGLFQAICRTNRLDGEDKTFGYIVDYKDLFKKLVNEKGTGALQVYTSELDHSAGGTSPEVLMQDRLKKGQERLDQALESIDLLCEPVQPPKGELEHIHYFCGNTEVPDDLKAHETQRVALYKSAAALLRAYANIADDLLSAGYSESKCSQIKQDVNRYVKLREIIRQASGETIDLKAYEADMRHLIDTYIEAKEPRKISEFGDIGLLDVIVKSGMADAISRLPDGIKNNKSAVAEAIANNVRSKIIKEHLNDPVFYEKMSALLKEIIADLKAKRIDYEEFLKRVADQVIKPLQDGKSADTPARLDTRGKRALYNTLGQNEQLALTIDARVKAVRPADWRGKKPRENVIKNALFPLLGNNHAEVERVFLILYKQTEY